MTPTTTPTPPHVRRVTVEDLPRTEDLTICPDCAGLGEAFDGDAWEACPTCLGRGSLACFNCGAPALVLVDGVPRCGLHVLSAIVPQAANGQAA